jgi:mxaD protein
MVRTVTWLIAAAVAAMCPQVAFAQAKEQSILETITIDAPPDQVWAVAADFAGLAKWYPMIESSKLVLGRNGEVGCIRELTRLNGTKVEEKLIDFNPWDHTLTYTYAGGQPLSSDYFATLTVKNAGDGHSLVEWKARFKGLDYTVDDPARDERLVKLLGGAYQKGLASLKEKVEGTHP